MNTLFGEYAIGDSNSRLRRRGSHVFSSLCRCAGWNSFVCSLIASVRKVCMRAISTSLLSVLHLIFNAAWSLSVRSIQTLYEETHLLAELSRPSPRACRVIDRPIQSSARRSWRSGAAKAISLRCCANCCMTESDTISFIPHEETAYSYRNLQADSFPNTVQSAPDLICAR